MTARLPLACTLLSALLLSSCGPWYIGNRIRYDSELHVGAALEHATIHYYADGRSLAWMKADPEHRSIGEPDYVLAPEVTYRVRKPLVGMVWDGVDKPAEITPTGRMVLVKPHGRTRDSIWDNELVEKLPEGMQADPQTVPKDKPFEYESVRQLGDLDAPAATRGSVGAQIAAAPFDYVIDPALSAVTLSPVLVPGAVVASAGIVIGTPIWVVQRLSGNRRALPPWKYHYLLP